MPDRPAPESPEEVLEPIERQPVRFTCAEKVTDALRQAGWMPIPPYIKRDHSLRDDGLDRERYQTVYARSEGAVAAPTAGLHFTEALLNRIREKGVNVLFLTLDVGWGTFQPVREEQVEEHRMHRERYAVPAAVAGALNGARRQKNRVVCVGTTAVRPLESAVMEDGSIAHGEGHTDLFIYPGYRFKAVDTLVTNFHLPRSTLVMLVAAFAGNDFILQAYREAVTLVTPGSEIEQLWLCGEYAPYDEDALINLVAYGKSLLPEYVRLQRIQRDIPAKLIVAGSRHSNFRQLCQQRLNEQGGRCRCIRCREVGRYPAEGPDTGSERSDMKRWAGRNISYPLFPGIP